VGSNPTGPVCSSPLATAILHPSARITLRVLNLANEVEELEAWKEGSRVTKERQASSPSRGYCQVGITSPPPALMILCVAAIAVTNSSRLFNFFEFTLLWNLFALFFNSLFRRSHGSKSFPISPMPIE
jgi:hypothetical protein